MDQRRIMELLHPFLGNATLSAVQLNNISMYIDILTRWNARINLTAVREPDEIVTRHFGESLFAARTLFPGDQRLATEDCIDLGSGAGFPGIPLKLWRPDLRLTLIESNQKKATFLREVVRTLTLTDINVFSGRGEAFPPATAALVTLRAVERFDTILPVARGLVKTGGRLALLIGRAQADSASRILPSVDWSPSITIPLSTSRVLLAGTI